MSSTKANKQTNNREMRCQPSWQHNNNKAKAILKNKTQQT